MIDVRNAVYRTKEYFQGFQDLFGEIQDLRLEEVELSDDRKFWLITLGFVYKSESADNAVIQSILESRQKRVYKRFKVNAESGEVEGITIREV